MENRNNGLAVLYWACDKIAGMLEIIELLTHYFVTLLKLLKPDGVKRKYSKLYSNQD
jgi:hypothetical protein